MNALLASALNGKPKEESINKVVANYSRRLMLESPLRFNLTEIKEQMISTFPDGYLSQTNSSPIAFNGQTKPKVPVDQNKNSFSNSFLVQNGNKGKAAEDGIPVPSTVLYTGKIHFEWRQIQRIGAGLTNLGNSCFMNTVIQCLTYCPPLANYLLSDEHGAKCRIAGFCMMCLLQKNLKRCLSKSGDVVRPYDVFTNMKLIAKHFQPGRQEDAHEFLRYVIDCLWKSCLAQNSNWTKLDSASKETTVINQIFGGYHRSQVTCMHCKEKSNTFDHFMDFMLDIKQNVLSLERALQKYIQPELLDQENSYICPNCKVKVSAQKKFTVYVPPNVATFQFKRFDYNRSFGGKIVRPISYPEKLDLRPYMSDNKGDPVIYSLYAVLVHSGSMCNSGHYYCYVKNSNNLWYLMDDGRVQQVPLGQVLSQVAYVLFYVRNSPSERVNSFPKKNIENKNVPLKCSNPAVSNKKLENSFLKSSPLQEKQSSLNVKPHAYPKLSTQSSTLNRERISFGIRTNQMKAQEGRSSPQPKTVQSSVGSPSKKMKPSLDVKIDTSAETSKGLVPYMKDSSESSDENDNRTAAATDSTGRTSSSCTNEELFPKYHIKRKMAKSSCPSGVQNSSSVGSQKSASSIWIGSDSSPTASTSPSVHSTTSDWLVTETSPRNDVIPGDAGSLDEYEATVSMNGDVFSPIPLPSSDNVLLASAQEEPIFSKKVETLAPPGGLFCSSKAKADVEGSSAPETPFRGGEGTPSKNCSFRDQQQDQPFLAQAEKHKDTPFLKRKCSDSDQEPAEEAAKPLNSEDRLSPLHKKAKHKKRSGSEDRVESGSPIGPQVSTKQMVNGYRQEDSELKSDPQENPSFLCNGVKKGSDAVGSDSDDSSDEEVWVEKTKESIEIKRQKEYKHQKSHIFNSSANGTGKNSVVDEMKKNSQFFYGSPVPTWKGKNHYREPEPSGYDKRNVLADYEDEYDRGKVRKFKGKNDFRGNYYPKSNPFQRFGERNSNFASNQRFFHSPRNYHGNNGHKWRGHNPRFQKHRPYGHYHHR